MVLRLVFVTFYVNGFFTCALAIMAYQWLSARWRRHAWRLTRTGPTAVSVSEDHLFALTR